MFLNDDDLSGLLEAFHEKWRPIKVLPGSQIAWFTFYELLWDGWDDDDDDDDNHDDPRMMMMININDCDDNCEYGDSDDFQQVQIVMIERDLNLLVCWECSWWTYHSWSHLDKTNN